MKVVCQPVPPPPPSKRERQYIMTLTEDEAKTLLAIAFFTDTIPKAIDASGWGCPVSTDSIKNLLNSIACNLKIGG